MSADPAPPNHPPLGDLLRPIKHAPLLRRMNGIGLTLAGVYREPTIAGAYYKQSVFTVLFFPVAWGAIYLVKSTGNRSWSMYGTVRGGDFIRRFGWGGYCRLKASILLETAVYFVFGAGLLVLLWLFLHRG
jgi:hypothetical protein